MANSTVAELIARSQRRLGSDPKNTNYAGGNTSAKGTDTDPVTGANVDLLWVKGSGGDLGTLTENGLAVLRLDRMRALVDVYPGRGPRGRDGRGVRLLPARHAAARHRRSTPPCTAWSTPRTSTTCTPTPASRIATAADGGSTDAADLRRPGGVGAVAPARLPARAWTSPRSRRRNPQAIGSHPRRPRHHRVGATSLRRGAGQLAGDHPRPPSSTSPHNGARAAVRRAAGRGTRALPGGRSAAPRPPHWRRSSGAWRRPTGPRSGTSPMTPRVLEFLGAGRASPAGRRSAPAAPTTSCAPRSSRWCSTCPPTPASRTARPG